MRMHGVWSISIYSYICTSTLIAALDDHPSSPSRSKREVQGVLRGLECPKTPMTWEESKKFCTGKGKVLAIPRNLKQMKLIKDVCKANVWIGAKELGYETLQDFVFLDGSTVAKELWDPGQPQSHVQSIEECVLLEVGGKLHDYPCDHKYPPVCHNTRRDKHGIWRGWECSNWAMTWSEAKNFCAGKGKTLALPKSVDVLEWVNWYCKKNVWIGAKRSREFLLLDGSTVPKELWDRNQPDPYDKTKTKEECVYLASKGKLHNYRCNHKLRPACHYSDTK